MSTGKFSRDKGMRAERQAVQMLQPVVTKQYEAHGLEAPQLSRNLMQTARGGYDIEGLEWLALEVKHHETLQLNKWWDQAKQQAGTSREPVLIYKQNNVKWRVMMYGYLPLGPKRIKCPVDISVDSFMLWFENRLIQELDQCKAQPQSPSTASTTP